MKKIIVLSIVGMAMIWAQGTGQEQGRGKKGTQNRPTFASYDLNGDGKIVQEEFYKAQADRMTKKANEGRKMKNAGNAPTFESIDSNGDKVLTPAEFEAHQANRQKHNGKGQGKGHGKGQGKGGQGKMHRGGGGR